MKTLNQLLDLATPNELDNVIDNILLYGTGAMIDGKSINPEDMYMGPTLEYLLDLAKQGKLDEIDTLAAEAQDWKSKDLNLYGKPEDYWWIIDGDNFVAKKDYHPTRNKAQAWKLAEKAGLDVDFNQDVVFFFNFKGALGLDHTYNLPMIVRVTIAFILAKQGG